MSNCPCVSTIHEQKKNYCQCLLQRTNCNLYSSLARPAGMARTKDYTHSLQWPRATRSFIKIGPAAWPWIGCRQTPAMLDPINYQRRWYALHLTALVSAYSVQWDGEINDTQIWTKLSQNPTGNSTLSNVIHEICICGATIYPMRAMKTDQTREQKRRILYPKTCSHRNRM